MASYWNVYDGGDKELGGQVWSLGYGRVVCLKLRIMWGRAGREGGTGSLIRRAHKYF